MRFGSPFVGVSYLGNEKMAPKVSSNLLSEGSVVNSRLDKPLNSSGLASGRILG